MGAAVGPKSACQSPVPDLLILRLSDTRLPAFGLNRSCRSSGNTYLTVRDRRPVCERRWGVLLARRDSVVGMTTFAVVHGARRGLGAGA
jgi:hypothetical protein